MGHGAPAQDAESTSAITTPSISILPLSAWTTVLLFWSIFTSPPKTFAARVLLFQPLWLLRIVRTEPTWMQDLGLVLALHSGYGLWKGKWELVSFRDLRLLAGDDEAIRVYLQVFTLLAGCGVLAAAIVLRGRQLAVVAGSTPVPHREQSIEDSVLPPLLITSRTSHTRLLPRKHSFSYSYLFVGVPVGLQGRISSVLSVDSRHPAWFDVRSADYLERGGDGLGLGERLKRYLHSKGVADRDYAFAYLVTAPRFLAYSFNPVSFWYLYDSDTKLKYMILEVNNTFDERRMYLLHADRAKEVHAEDDDDDDGTEETTTTPLKTLVFSETWSKDFHVSPFNSRKGTYSLRATDPLAAFQETGAVAIDNTIVLRSSKDEPKIVARVFSEGPPIDPDLVTPFQLVKLLAGWWWVGLATFPRIVWEAQKLFFQRKLHVWYRPETTASSIGRSYTSDERALEASFRAFLADSVESAHKPLRVIYEPAHNDDAGEIIFYSPHFTYEEDQSHTLTLKVLSPAFYSRFVHYAHAQEAFDRECLATHEENRTIILQGAHALPILLHAIRDITIRDPPPKPLGLLACAKWSLLRQLRCPPAAASYSTGDSYSRLDPEFGMEDIRTFPFSELDRYMQQQPPYQPQPLPPESGSVDIDPTTYRRVTTKLFLAQRIALGFPTVVVLGDWILRAFYILVAMGLADSEYASSHALDVLRPRSDILRVEDVLATGWVVIAANTVHGWSFLKG